MPITVRTKPIAAKMIEITSYSLIVKALSFLRPSDGKREKPRSVRAYALKKQLLRAGPPLSVATPSYAYII